MFLLAWRKDSPEEGKSGSPEDSRLLSDFRTFPSFGLSVLFCIITPMVLSVIIVSYNVKYFLEQCLCSVQRAAGSDVEVFVIDNRSSDGTVDYLRHRFPLVQFISNNENVGFAKANNQVLEKATG